MKTPRLLILAFAATAMSLFFTDTARAEETVREWTDVKGRKVLALFLSVDANTDGDQFISLKTADGGVHRLPIKNLIKEDQALALSLQPSATFVPTNLSTADAAAKIDALIYKMLAAKGIKPNAPSSDEQFMRRAYLDIAGRIPSLEEATVFLSDSSANRRAKLIDQLLDSPGYNSHLYNYFADMFRIQDPNNGRGLVRAQPYVDWLKDRIARNKPYNETVALMLTASGKLWNNGATGYLLRDSGMLLDNLSNTFAIFLGTDVACAQCHDHPFSEWTQMQFYQLAAFFGATSTRANGRAMAKKKGEMAVDPQERIMAELTAMNADMATKVERQVRDIIEANRLVVSDTGENRLRLPMDYKYKDAKGGDPVAPKFITWGKTDRRSGAYKENKTKEEEKLRDAFAGWLTHPENPRFGVTIANRLWKRAFGQGVAEPVRNVDDPKSASNPELLVHLGAEMVRLGFDLKKFQRIIYNTNAWQRSTTTEAVPMGTHYYFQGPLLHRMTAEQAWDSFVTLMIGNPDYLRNEDGGQMQNAIDIDVDKTDGKVMASKLEALQRARSDKKEKVNGNIATAGDDMMKRDEIVGFAGMKLMRASELEQPAPAGHFLREFGQSNRELVDGGELSGSQPQVLMLMNGKAQEMLTTANGRPLRAALAQDLPKKKVETLYLSILGREPTEAEKTRALAEMTASGDKDGLENITWALLNSLEFMFVQ